MKSNILLDKSYLFAVNILNAVKILNRSMENYVLVKQLIRSATSIGANAEESQGGYSKKDFIHKLNICYKEAKETKYWIRLIIDTQLSKKADIEIFKKALEDADELCRIIFTIIRTSGAKQEFLSVAGN
jgi:four helix bundle protein